MATPEWIKKEMRTNFARASRAGRQAAKTEPRAARAAYQAKDNTLRIELTNGAAISVPVKLIPALKGASPNEVRSVEVLGRGGGLHWESMDVDLSVPGLVSSVFAGPEWMAELGRVGGRKSSTAKAAAARKNGRKGGRPRGRTPADTRA
jgi:hypothetical protein